jgi:predicted metal-dependent phosphoesterase TrpH
MIFRGVFHAHSTHSYDGRTPLPELCASLRARGYHFLLLTEHDDKLNAAHYAGIVEECARLSSAEFLAVAGLEVRCWKTPQEQWHIAGVGVGGWVERGEIAQVVARIQAQGGLAVLLHPHKYGAQMDWRELQQFDGVELWNGKEDGTWSPPGKTLRLGQQVARQGGRPLYVGHDLHGADERFPLAIEIELPRLAREAVFAALRQGQFTLCGRGLRMAAGAGPSAWQQAQLLVLRAFYNLYRGVRRVPGLGALAGRAARSHRESS